MTLTLTVTFDRLTYKCHCIRVVIHQLLVASEIKDAEQLQHKSSKRILYMKFELFVAFNSGAIMLDGTLTSSSSSNLQLHVIFMWNFMLATFSGSFEESMAIISLVSLQHILLKLHEAPDFLISNLIFLTCCFRVTSQYGTNGQQKEVNR